VVCEHWHDHDMAFLHEVGKALVRQAPDKVAVLAAGPSGDGSFLLVASESTGLDPAHAGATVAAILGGRGGGRAPFFQGKATDLGRLGEAVAALEKELRENSEFGIRNSETDLEAHS
jgi:alanyl-tRNA synthetase